MSGASPSGLGAARMIAGMSLRRTRRGGLIWLPVAVLALLLVAAVAALLAGKAGLEFFDACLGVLLRYMIPFVMLLLGSSAVGEEVQQKTITYLFSRPMPRWALPMGKFLGNLGVSYVLLVPATLLLYVLSMLGETELFAAELPHLGLALLSVALATLYYAAFATAFGTMVTRAALVVGMVVFGVLDVGFGFIPGGPKVIAINVHLRVIAGLYEPQVTSMIRDPELTLPISLIVVPCVTLIWLVIAVSWVNNIEYRTDK